MAVKRPPGPSGSVLGIGLMRQIKQDYLGFVRRMHAEHGDVFHMRLGFENIYNVACPELLRELLVDHNGSLVRWDHLMKVFSKDHGQSVLTTDKEVWQRQRRMLLPSFSARCIQGYSDLMVDAAIHTIDEVTAPESQIAEFEQLMGLLTMSVIVKTLFGSTSAEENASAERSVQIITTVHMDEALRPFVLPDWVPMPGSARKRRAREELNELIWRHIRARRGVPNANRDLLDRLLAMREGDDALSEQEIRDQCMTMFLAGHETTAAALTWWGWAMASHPECARRATAEVDRVLGSRPPSVEDLPALGYLTQTIKEAMRLYPPAPVLFARRAVSDIQIGPWCIPNGSLVMLSPWVVHRDVRWYDRPDEFNPDRFSPQQEGERPRGAYFPFGTGHRVCIGNTFAMNEMLLITAMLLQRVELSPEVPERAVAPVMRTTLRPADNLRLRLKRRSNRPQQPAPAPSEAAQCPFHAADRVGA